MLPWEQGYNNAYKPFIIMDNKGNIRKGCDTEPEVMQEAMILSFGKGQEVEVYRSTGFAKWKLDTSSRIQRNTEMKK
jgi:hypothetical protein